MATQGQLHQHADATLDPTQIAGPVFEQPCTLKGIQSAFAAGAFGYLLGFAPAVFRFKAKSWGLINKEGWRSAQTIAVMSGLYTTVSCITARIRQKEDNVTRGISGCATGLAIGWQGGPLAMLQSCAGIGALSYIFDFGGSTTEGPAKAAGCYATSEFNCGSCQVLGSISMAGSRPAAGNKALGMKLQRTLIKPARFTKAQGALQLPPVMWLATVANSSYFG